MEKAERDPQTESIIACAIEVHKELGPGLLESIYESAMALELGSRGIRFLRQLQLPVLYKGTRIDGTLRVDLLVEDSVVVEVKCVDQLLPVHAAQVLSYMRLGGWSKGLLMNFKVANLAGGIRRLML